MSSHRSRSVERIVRAHPSAVFEVLVDPSQHTLIDGSGMVQGRPVGPDRLELGSSFSMAMKQRGLGYRSVSHVVELEPDRRIAWHSGGEVRGRRIVGGQTWRFELEPHPDGTLVRETYDWSTAMLPWLTIELGGYPDKMEAAMAATLERLAGLVEGR